MSSRAASQLLVDLCDVEPARGEQHVEVVDEIGGLLDDTLVALLERGDRELDRLLPHLACARSNTAVEQRDGVRALGPLGCALRDRPPERGRETRDAARVTRRSRRRDPKKQSVAVAVVAQLLDGERVAGGLALAPQPLARAAPEPGLPGLA